MDQDEPFTPSDKDWENRRLCSDGNCIGVINSDGICKECGQKYNDTAIAGDDYAQEDPPENHPDDEKPDSVVGVSEDAETDNEWEHRRLCPDGNCIGIIGKDGNCKECGKPYK